MASPPRCHFREQSATPGRGECASWEKAELARLGIDLAASGDTIGQVTMVFESWARMAEFGAGSAPPLAPGSNGKAP